MPKRPSDAELRALFAEVAEALKGEALDGVNLPAGAAAVVFLPDGKVAFADGSGGKLERNVWVALAARHLLGRVLGCDLDQADQVGQVVREFVSFLGAVHHRDVRMGALALELLEPQKPGDAREGMVGPAGFPRGEPPAAA